MSEHAHPSQTIAESAPPATSKDRDTKTALMRGWGCKCPKCGEGKVLHSYLKVNDNCDHCGLDLSLARADDGPAYLTILLVGHLMAPLLHVVYFKWEPAPWVTFSTFSIGCVLACLFLLPRMKGMVISYQWARGMHGYDTKG